MNRLARRALMTVAYGRPRADDGRLARAVGGKTVLVTGASYGIGEATALRLAAAGATVLLVARTAEKLETVAQGITAADGSAYALPCNLADPAEVRELVARVLDEHGHVDVLVSNAGRSIRRAVTDSYERFHDVERTNAVNYLGPVQLVLGLLPSMTERGEGQLVNVSTAGVRTPPMARWSAYLASKSAFDTWLRCVAQEVRVHGVATSTVYMGLVRTRMSEPTAALNRLPALTPEEAAGLVCDAIVYRPNSITPPLAAATAGLGHVFRTPTDRLLSAYYRLTR